MESSPSRSGQVSKRTRGAPGVWVVGIDGSPSSRHAALWAAGHVAGRCTELRLLAAWHPPLLSPVTPWGTLSMATPEEFAASTQEQVDRLASELRSGIEIPVEAIVCRGGPAASLLEAGRHAALLVVGSRGRGGFGRLALGSTSTQCATHAEVPTAVVPLGSPIGSVRRIVVGIDGSPNSRAAARWAIDFAHAGTVIECVMVWDVTPLVGVDDAYIVPEPAETVRGRFAETMDEMRRATDRHDLQITERFEEGVPRRVLRDVAQQSDLFVMGARGQGAIASMLLGSVSSWLLHHVDRPIVVVPDAD
jgi:nucleotide-binding universal stress UspA family protein